MEKIRSHHLFEIYMRIAYLFPKKEEVVAIATVASNGIWGPIKRCLHREHEKDTFKD